MKEQDIFDAIGNVDPEMVAAADLKPHARAIKRRKFAVWAACISIFILSLNLWLFLPFSGELKDLSRYSDSEYYGLMLKVQELAEYPPNSRYLNNFDKYFRTHEQSGEGVLTASTLMPGVPADKYEETTDNQFEGIIEGDLFKRSDKAVFYLDPSTLTLYSYSIAGEDSVKLDSFAVADEFGIPINKIHYYNSVIYLSPDCGSVTVILPQYQKTMAVSIDVSNPAEMKKGEVIEMSGGFITSRMIEGKLLMITGWGIERNPDFSKESEYLPQIAWNGETHSLAAEDIVYTEEAWRPFYTVMAMLDMNSLEVVDSAAVLDYAGVVTVSEENIFLACTYNENVTEPGENENETISIGILQSNIYVVSHSNGALENKGNFRVNGMLIDQYALDEKDGVLRLVTETSVGKYVNRTYSEGGYSFSLLERKESADLYCIDLETFEIIGSITAFSPDGEDVTSVRFEGDMAYVCTAERQYYCDPVYFFDLSDPANITYSDTGVIDGYSTSLVDMGDGKLLGIGYGDSNQTLKVEVYEEREDKVVSVCSFERKFVIFSEDYKSYYINRAEGYVGLMVVNAYVSEYLLLRFDGENVTQIAKQGFPIVKNEGWARATVIDSTLYIFTEDEFKTIQLEQ